MGGVPAIAWLDLFARALVLGSPAAVAWRKTGLRTATPPPPPAFIASAMDGPHRLDQRNQSLGGRMWGMKESVDAFRKVMFPDGSPNGNPAPMPLAIVMDLKQPGEMVEMPKFLGAVVEIFEKEFGMRVEALGAFRPFDVRYKDKAVYATTKDRVNCERRRDEGRGGCGWCGKQ